MPSKRKMANRTITSKRKWAVDLSGRRGERGSDNLPAPPGFMSSVNQVHAEANRQGDPNLVIKKAWDIALSPLKSVPMNLFLMFMAGSSISIFPIMMVGMMLLRPIKALWATNTTFKSIEGTHAALQKLIYLLGNFVNVGLALYKCHSMGILPTHASDWLAFQEPAIQMEFSYGGMTL
ncbi:ER membrane protein complex subunit 4-like isoform X1 [Penaeus monodon]|uniref:ER membrane protein complex subunit 4-like isoform X1 n=1 Tax=Penaeus monodon TaxID=6687 RepID=UPI0018A78D36|nr:ER membrane protein complex subunit 4-like isoform X1 [Penaeus monodon]